MNETLAYCLLPENGVEFLNAYAPLSSILHVTVRRLHGELRVFEVSRRAHAIS